MVIGVILVQQKQHVKKNILFALHLECVVFLDKNTDSAIIILKEQPAI